MHRLASSFVLGYHGSDGTVGERLLAGSEFRLSENDYDWLGPGVYFWEANPKRGLEFAAESIQRKTPGDAQPFVVGAVIELGSCLDLTTANGIEWLKGSYESLTRLAGDEGFLLPSNSQDGLRRNLDCAVIRHLLEILEEKGLQPVDTVKGIFTEGPPAYPGSGFQEKTHVQIAVRNLRCIKGVFRVPQNELRL